ncbi:putative HET-domain-containing protein [Seiridium cardinale]|uniref:HET-domain-containing protein n=1 Tax=Seiridium cardinale TaxID=138064 RepID=A0ABR2X8C8_9PEZI
MKLTRESYNAFLGAIQFDSLSKTFRDAITAARNLGFQYLWIDSLCVIQEDEEDWQHESAKMGHVYSNSSLNIAAAGSPDADTGFFFHNRPESPNAWKVTFPNTGPVPSAKMHSDSSYEGTKWYTWNCINSGTKAVIDDNQLASRAWTLQERLLSPRTLYFGCDQIAWECRVCNAYEALPDMFQEGIRRMSPGNYFNLVQATRPLAHVHNVRQWSDLVENYSQRKLTFDRDKLIAISGLARILAPIYRTNYIAGLWEKDMVRLLTWHKYISTSSIAKNGATAYRAPSWSWASVDGRVSFPDGFLEPLEGDYAASINDDRMGPPLVKVIDAVTTFVGDQFGEVTSGFLRISVQALFRTTIYTGKWVRNGHFPVYIHGFGEINQFTAYPDYDLESIEGDSLLMPLAIGERDYPNDCPEMRGLFIEYVEDGVYRRKGAWRMGGEYSALGSQDLHNKVISCWRAKSVERTLDRTVTGLNQGELASLWDEAADVISATAISGDSISQNSIKTSSPQQHGDFEAVLLEKEGKMRHYIRDKTDATKVMEAGSHD